MKAPWYPRMMRALCERIEINDWSVVLECQQIEVNGFNVALFPDQVASSSLAMYVELANHDANQHRDLLISLLESNAAEPGALGYFGVLPGSGMIVYRLTLKNADVLSCEELMTRMIDLVASGTAQFHSIMSRQMGNKRSSQNISSALMRQRRGRW